MARSPAPPGPPPPNYRPPGAPAGPPPPLVGRTQNRATAGAGSSTGSGAGAVAAVAIGTLILGLVVGFFLGRATETDDIVVSGAPPLTSPQSSTGPPPGDTIPQEPPVDPDAPPSTDLEPSGVGTIDAPIAAGQAYVLGLYEIEVRGVDRDAADVLADFHPGNPSPPAGSRHVIVEIAMRYTDADGYGNPSSIPFFVSDGDRQWQDVDARCGIVPDSILDTALVEAGDEVVGNACFTVPEDAVESLLLGTEGVNGPIYFLLPG